MVGGGVEGAWRYVCLDGLYTGIGLTAIEDYVLFDCPGQVELFTHHASLRNIFFKLQKLGYRVRPNQSLLEIEHG